VFVPEFDEGDLVDLYRLRRIVECDVIRSLTGLETHRLRPLRAEVEAAELAASRGDWSAVVTANMRFHQRLVLLSGSRRIHDITRRLLAELRLVFHVVADPEVLHERYIRRNRALLDLLEAGQISKAADEMERYLRDSEEELVEAYRSVRTPRRTRSAKYAQTQPQEPRNDSHQPGAYRDAPGAGHHGPVGPRLRRPGRPGGRRHPGVLGLRCHPAGGVDGVAPTLRHHSRTGATCS
jgi:FCD domain